MKVYSDGKKKFIPIVIKLETEEDYHDLQDILNRATKEAEATCWFKGPVKESPARACLEKITLFKIDLCRAYEQ